MKSKRFTDEKVIKILQEAETGLSVADVCRKHNCSEQSCIFRANVRLNEMRCRVTRVMDPQYPAVATHKLTPDTAISD